MQPSNKEAVNCQCLEIAKMKHFIEIGVERELAWILAKILIAQQRIETGLQKIEQSL